MQDFCCRLILNVLPLLSGGLVLSVETPGCPRCTSSAVCAAVPVELVGVATAAPGMPMGAAVTGRHVGSAQAAICMNNLVLYPPTSLGVVYLHSLMSSLKFE